MEEDCYVGRHLAMVLCIALPGLLVYGLGVPALAFLILWRRHRTNMLLMNKYIFGFGLLYSGYRKDRWWWECVVVLRKLAVILITTFLYEDSMQLHVMMLVLIIAFAAHHIYLPFHELKTGGEEVDVVGEVSESVHGVHGVHGASSDNVPGSEMSITHDGLMLHRLERNSLLVLLILLWCAGVFVMSEGTCNSPLCIFLTVFVFGTNVLFLIQGFTMFVRYFLKRTKLAYKVSTFLKNKAASMASRRKTTEHSDRNTELEMSVKTDSNNMMSNPMDAPNSPIKCKRETINPYGSGEVNSVEKAEVEVEMENTHIQTHSDKNGWKYEYNTLTGKSEWLTPSLPV
jgi:hypothetical protein